MEKILISALTGKPVERTPFWFMRQAGRYLPEYRELRQSVGGFLELCFNPEKAAEVTLQPIDRFQMDGAILFSDILVIPHALGIEVRFEQGEGPVVEQVKNESDIGRLVFNIQKLEPIFETVRLVKKRLPEEVAFIGFAGAPWTAACYMLEGPRNKTKTFKNAIRFAKDQPGGMQKLIDTLTSSTILYLQEQIDSGVEAVQLFDSWAGLLSEKEFFPWVIEPTKIIVSELKKSHPHIPIIGFARGAGEYLSAYANTGVDCIGIDQETDIAYGISCRAWDKQSVQGNLDPELMANNKAAALKQTEEILQKTKHTPHVFNFGHGMLPHTPIENVAAVCEYLRTTRKA